MRAFLPGKPEARLQAVSTAYWQGYQLIAYITGNAFVIFTSYNTLVQTIYADDATPLEAIAIDEASGKVATCAGPYIRLYKPDDRVKGKLKWSLQTSIRIDDDGSPVSTLSWGIAEELLVGGWELVLYSTSASPEIVWRKKLANPARLACLSYDSAYLASIGSYDHLVKVWRRLSFGSDDVRFDFTYLPHPQIVTDVRWRRPYHLDQTIDNVLYSICMDNKLRIWSPTDHHGLQSFQLWGQIDLQESIQSRLATSSQLTPRFTFVIDGRDFSKATEFAVQQLSRSSQDHALEHLIEVATRSPEVCVVLDQYGHMSAWGIENLGNRTGKTQNIFNIAHISGLEFDLQGTPGSENFTRIYNYCSPSGGNLNVMLHNFEGKIEIYECNLAHLFDPSRRAQRTTLRATWTGHSQPIKKMVRNVTGSSVVSRTDANESVIWRHTERKEGTVLQLQSVASTAEPIHRICVLADGEFVVFLHESRIALWDCRSSKAHPLAAEEYTLRGNPLCILLLPETEKHENTVHIATVSSQMKGIVWQLQLPEDAWRPQDPTSMNLITEFCTFDLGDAHDLAYVLPVDPAGSAAVISGFLDTFARDVAISYSHMGLLRSWTAKVERGRKTVDWLLTCSVETGILNPALVSGSSIRKAALVNSSRSELTIWDTKASQLEYCEDYGGQDTIQDLDWTSTPDDQSILAVGFRHRVVLLSQMRFDYLNKGPAWAAIREITIQDLTPHPIGDSTWLGGGNLVIGAGSQMIVYDRTIDLSPSLASKLRLKRHGRAELNLFEVVTRLNGPLPLFHPQFLSQCILAGKMSVVQQILLSLYKCLKYYVDGDQIDSFLGIPLETVFLKTEKLSSSAAKEELTEFTAISDLDNLPEMMTETIASAINEKLTVIPISQLSGQEQIQLRDVVECVALVEKQRRSMDENAARFMLFFRQHILRRGRANETSLSWREINWAFHSNSQDILSEMVAHQYRDRMLWQDARECGVFMWISDPAALKQRFEAVARNEYTRSDLKNPVDCSLFYLALKKKAVLSGLWRMAGWNREQGATLRLLANNFQEPKWKTVAMKNAYALLGKHRFQYAAAFFLLADCLKDAVNVCLNQLKDIQLAITIARVYEGDNGPVLREVLEEKVLPLAAQEGNRWLAAWAFWMLHRRDMAVRALIAPVYTLLESPQSPDQNAKLYLADDPALVVLYSQLRQTTLQALQGAFRVTPKIEWDFILHSAKLYDRMGCDLLALELVRTWEFLLVPSRNSHIGSEADPRTMLRRRGSLVVADLPPANKHGDNLKKPPPKVFEEPESSSLLDSFGF